jgi:hypothetical protein
MATRSCRASATGECTGSRVNLWRRTDQETVKNAAQLIAGKPISTRRVAMCAGHIISELVATLLACAGIAEVFREGIAFLLANARRANPKRNRKVGRLRSGLVVVGIRS